MQQDILVQVGAALGTPIDPPALGTDAWVRSVNVLAYEAYLRGASPAQRGR